MKNEITSILANHMDCVNTLNETNYLSVLEIVVSKIIETYKNGNKVLIAGNGGSAADAQHFAAELVGRFLLERRGLPAIALTTDSSILTCLGNDYGYDYIFERQIEALGKEGDLFIGISTSGNSSNIISAVNKAKEQKMNTVCFLGKDGGKLKDISDINLIVEYPKTAHVQEVHIMAIHTICELVEKEMKNIIG